MAYQSQIFNNLADDNLIRFFFHLVESENCKQPNLEIHILAVHWNYLLFFFNLNEVIYLAAINRWIVV